MIEELIYIIKKIRNKTNSFDCIHYQKHSMYLLNAIRMCLKNYLYRASTEIKQSGVVSSLTSEEILAGDNSYGWFGYSMHSFFANDKNYVAISSPKAYSPDSLSYGGKVEIRAVNDLSTVITTLYGSQEFENFGHIITTGNMVIEVKLIFFFKNSVCPKQFIFNI